MTLKINLLILVTVFVSSATGHDKPFLNIQLGADPTSIYVCQLVKRVALPVVAAEPLPSAEKLVADQQTDGIMNFVRAGETENLVAEAGEPVTEPAAVSIEDRPMAGGLQARGLFPQASETGNRQSGILGSIFNKLNGAAGGSPDPASVSLVEDEAKLSKSFQQEQSLEKQATSSTVAPVNATEIKQAPSTSTTTSTTTTSTTTPMPSTSTMSPEEVEQEKIFKEFFGSRDSGNSNLNLLISSFARKLGFGKPVPASVLKQNIQSELASLHATSTEAPVLALPIVAAPIAPALLAPAPAAPVPAAPSPNYQLSTSLPPLPTTDYNGASGHPAYMSYDEAKEKIASTYLVAKPPVYAGHVEAIKKPAAAYADPLKGQVNGPVEVPALIKYPAGERAKLKLDYVESEKPSYRTNDFRLGSISPFNRIPALSGYSNAVSSVSRGFSSLYAGAKPQNPAKPLHV